MKSLILLGLLVAYSNGVGATKGRGRGGGGGGYGMGGGGYGGGGGGKVNSLHLKHARKYLHSPSAYRSKVFQMRLIFIACNNS